MDFKLALGCTPHVKFEQGIRTVTDVLYQISGIGLNMCSAECLAHTDCLSDNYNMEHLICYLNKEDSITESAKHTVSVTKSQLQIVCKDCLNSCDLSCPPRHKCMKSTSGAATCVALDCGAFPSLEKGKKDKDQDSTAIGADITYSCDKGFAADGPLTITCSANGLWTPQLGRCLRCGHIPELQNANTKDKNRAFNAVVTYSCNPCYENVGDISISCLANETWTPIQGYCRDMLVTCNSEPPTISNAVLTSGYDNFCGAMADYKCNEGYQGNPSSVCQDDGNWHIHGRCKAICTNDYIEEEQRKGEYIQLCWRVFTNTKTYDEAMADCETRSINGRPLVINSNLKRNRVSSALIEGFGTPNKTLYFWVNGRYGVHGTYYGFSNGELSKDNWMNGQPDRSGNCLAVSSAGSYKWNDLVCTRKFAYICEAAIY
ncbi:sushi, von Willebrand factor type A, EGF and pentraxin domain-containing protein 1-like [Saccostrea cucullata]|uniref:sushi, von Willebrand factor type A, EGF and pentraxin domain-containing protein 1-like n=1 Tax=Saccostrea cuccullata TaxID=36930 RepID=UPI002ED193B2